MNDFYKEKDYKEFSDIKMSSVMNPAKKNLIDAISADRPALTRVIAELFFMLSERERKLVLINIGAKENLLYSLDFSWSANSFADELAKAIVFGRGDADLVLGLLSNNT